MAVTLPLWLLCILVCLPSLAVGFAASYWGRAFASSQLRKQLRELETEVASLTSEYSKVTALAKKISNRVALDDHRHRRNGSGPSAGGSPPPIGDKAAAKAYYLNGKTHAQIAREAMGVKE